MYTIEAVGERKRFSMDHKGVSDAGEYQSLFLEYGYPRDEIGSSVVAACEVVLRAALLDALSSGWPAL